MEKEEDEEEKKKRNILKDLQHNYDKVSAMMSPLYKTVT